MPCSRRENRCGRAAARAVQCELGSSGRQNVDATEAALIGAAVGAAGGIAGGALAALATIRANQVTARAPLASILVEMEQALINAATGTGTQLQQVASVAFECAWNAFATHQRILCPSKRLEETWNVLRLEFQTPSLSTRDKLAVSSRIVDLTCHLVAAHSGALFRWRAEQAEVEILSTFLASPSGQALAPASRSRLERVLNP